MQVIADCEAVVFDVLGTLVDEPGGLRDEISTAAPKVDGSSIPQLVTEWQRYVARQQQWIVEGRREYATTADIDEEAARLVAELASIDDLAAIAKLATASQRLPAWKDSNAGLEQLAQRFPVIGLSNADSVTLLQLSFHAGLRWHQALSSDAVRQYKPSPAVYQLAVDATGLPPERVLMVAAHAWDLRGAQEMGMRTAYLQRPNGDPPASSDAFDGQFDSLDQLVAAAT